MANDVRKLLDLLFNSVDEAKSPPFSSDKCVLERDAILDLIDEIRSNLPVELKKAQDLLRSRDEFVDSAKREVDRMLKQADLDAKTKVSESEVLMAAREKSNEIVRRAEERCREMYRVANEYAEDTLARTEEAIAAALDEVKENRAKFRAVSSEQMQRRREELDGYSQEETDSSES
jgi:cell division septum initiation protein DivIVA